MEGRAPAALVLLACLASAVQTQLYLQVVGYCGFVEEVLINGVNTTQMNHSGAPYNLTFKFSLANVSAHAVEENGYLPFALPQYIDSNVSSLAEARSELNGSNSVSITLVPTGAAAIRAFEQQIGNYSLYLVFRQPSMPDCIINLTLANRDLSTDYSKAQIPNRDNIAYFNDYLFRLYSNAKWWGGGEVWNVTVFLNGTAEGVGFNLTAGKPAEFNVTVLNGSSPVEGALVSLSEANGFQPWGAMQYQESVVSNTASGWAVTGADGNARITVIPTGGLPFADAVVGEYGVLFSVKVNESVAYNSTVQVSNRGLTQPPGSGGSVANQNNIIYYNDYLFRVYAGVKEWLWR